jgi:hypothetical protein
MADSKVVFSRDTFAPQSGADTLFNLVDTERKNKQEIEKTQAIEGFRNDLAMKRDAAQFGFNSSLEELRSGLVAGREEAAYQRSVTENMLKGQATLGAAGSMAVGAANQGMDMKAFVDAQPTTEPDTGQVMGIGGYTPKQFDPRSADFVTTVLGEHIKAELQKQGTADRLQKTHDLEMVFKQLDLIGESHVNQAADVADFLEKADPGNAYVPMLRGFTTGSAKKSDFYNVMKPAIERRETLRARMEQIKELGKTKVEVAEIIGRNKKELGQIKAAASAGADRSKQLNQLRDNLNANVGRVQMAIATFTNQLQNASGTEADNIRREMTALRLQERQLLEQQAELNTIETKAFSAPPSPKDEKAIYNEVGGALIMGPEYRKYRTPTDMPEKLRNKFISELQAEVNKRMGR